MGEQDIFEQATKEADEKQVVDFLLSNVENILINGTPLILDKVSSKRGKMNYEMMNTPYVTNTVVVRGNRPYYQQPLIVQPSPQVVIMQDRYPTTQYATE